MKALLFSRLVDIYNNIPYTDALNGGTNNFPTYDNAESVYKAQVDQLDSAVALISSAATSDAAPGDDDILFGGDMDAWKAFANTVKLKILMHLTQASGGTAYIQSKLSGMTTADFIGTKADAGVDPGYSNDANNHQTPLWNDIGSNTSEQPILTMLISGQIVMRLIFTKVQTILALDCSIRPIARELSRVALLEARLWSTTMLSQASVGPAWVKIPPLPAH
jgi:hypothetical protein